MMSDIPFICDIASEVDQGPNKVENYFEGQRPLINDVSFSEQSRIAYMH